MNQDNRLMLEALQSKFTQGRGPVNDIVVSELHKMHTALNQMATMIDLNPSDEVDQLLSKIRDVADMLIADKPAEDAEHEPHGYPQGMTAIQNLVLNELKKRGFQLTKIVHADKDRDKYPTVFMKRSKGPMHAVAEIDGMGSINGEPYQEYLANLKDASEDAEDMSKSPFHYDAMHGLASAAHKIKDELKSAANDEARTEHIEKMAEIILGPQSEYASVTQYRRILSGVIELLKHHVMVEMN